MTFSEALEITDFNYSSELKGIVEGTYDVLTSPSSSPSEDTACVLVPNPPSSPTISLSFAATGDQLPNDFTYLLWLGKGGKMWMQVHAPTTPNGNQVITHTIPEGLVDTNGLKGWVVGVSHNSTVEVHVTACGYGWNNELTTVIPGTPDTVHTLEFAHPLPFGDVFDETTLYYTEPWCSARFNVTATKASSPGFAIAIATWWIDSQYGRIFDNLFVSNTASPGFYSSYIDVYPLMNSSKLSLSSVLNCELHRSNTNNITAGSAQVVAAGFTGTALSTFTGATMEVPAIFIDSPCSFTE